MSKAKLIEVINLNAKNNNERIFENSNSFFNALTNILENQNVRVLTENKSKINTIK